MVSEGCPNQDYTAVSEKAPFDLTATLSPNVSLTQEVVSHNIDTQLPFTLTLPPERTADEVEKSLREDKDKQ